MKIHRTKQGFKYEDRSHGPVKFKKPYVALMPFSYYSKRYGKHVHIPQGMDSDGATGAWDITSLGWWVHDRLCNTGQWGDGTRCTNWQASMVLFDILRSEGRWWRDHWWLWSTFLFGGGKCRKNGLFRLKERYEIRERL